jgi:hypothetical protein
MPSGRSRAWGSLDVQAYSFISLAYFMGEASLSLVGANALKNTNSINLV